MNIFSSQIPPQALTVKSTGILREIITDAKISKFAPPESIAGQKTVDVKALWDTGATGSVVTETTAKTLGLVPIGKARCVYGGNETDENVYLICIFLPNRVIFSARVTECRDKTQFGLIIGMDIISRGDFSITNKNDRTIFSFRVPSIAEHDYVVEENQRYSRNGHKQNVITAPTRNNKVDPNLPCPCGSGQKWKQCHGRLKSKFHN